MNVYNNHNVKLSRCSRRIGILDFSNHNRRFIWTGQRRIKDKTLQNHSPVMFPFDNVRSPSTKTSNHLNVLALNCQSVRDIASTLHDRLLDERIDIAILTETWLKEEDDEAYLSELAGNDFKIISFPRSSGRGGGIAFIIKNHLQQLVVSKRLHFQSMEAAELSIKTGQIISTFICVYRLHPNKKINLSFNTFFDEFPILLSEYMNKKNDFHLHGDFNLHFNKPNEFYVSKMLTLLKDHGLNQLVDTPTQRCGNILDWIIVRADSSLLSYDCVRELPGLSDHYGIFSVLSIETLKPSFRQIKYRNIKDIQMEIFQQQIHQSAQKIYIKYTDCKDPSELAEITNKCLADILDQHAPLLSKVVKDRPPAPWKTSEVKEAKRIARRAERKYRKSGLTIDREISIEKSKASVKMINKSRKDYYSSEINSCSTSKQVFSISDSLLGKSKSKQLPNDLPMSQLPETFSQYFVDKIKNIRQELDHSTNSSLSEPIFESYI